MPTNDTFLVAQCQAFISEVTRLQHIYPSIYAIIVSLHFKHRIPIALVIQSIEHEHHDDFWYIQRRYVPSCLRLCRNHPIFVYSPHQETQVHHRRYGPTHVRRGVDH